MFLSDYTSEGKISNFQKILPRLDLRRGLMDLGGSALKSLFGVATVADAHKLHESLNDLQTSYSDVAHSLSSQLTYIKNLDSLTDLNANAITNLSSIVKDMVMQSHDRFQEVTKEIMWLNISLFGQRSCILP
jgi:RNAse (barnase) inhibitor barstar